MQTSYYQFYTQFKVLSDSLQYNVLVNKNVIYILYKINYNFKVK